MPELFRPPSGHVFRRDRKRGSAWYAKYRLPDGRQVQKKLGPAWTERGRPPVGYLTKRAGEAWLGDTLAAARRGTLPGLVRTRATFADAADEWIRYVREDRDCKPSTLRDYRSVLDAHILPSFGELQLEDMTPQLIEEWRAGMSGVGGRPLSNRTRNKALTILGGVLERARKAYGLPSNPARDVEKLRERYDARHSSSPPRSPECAAASSSPFAGATSISSAWRSGSLQLRERQPDLAEVRTRQSRPDGS